LNSASPQPAGGSGKSSLGNTLLGDSLLKAKTSPTSEASECQAVTKFINGRNITVIDNPGFFDTTMDEDKLKKEIVRCMVECAPGPHAFFIVLKVNRYTAQEDDVIKNMLGCFSEEALKFTTVVFTHGDELPERMRIEEFVCQSDRLSDLVKRCGGRYHVKQIFNTIDKMVMENKGGCYTNEMLQRVEEEKKKGGDSELCFCLFMYM
uniref:AIG1-type G domain-containing protein n=1 Tax=Monopterus albus TaxID=43700 RepID=A0A3Q3J3S1_MONAL